MKAEVIFCAQDLEFFEQGNVSPLTPELLYHPNSGSVVHADHYPQTSSGQSVSPECDSPVHTEKLEVINVRRGGVELVVRVEVPLRKSFQFLPGD